MFCSNCGNPVHEGGKFCPNCGSKILPDNVPVYSSEPPAENINVPETTPVQESVPMPEVQPTPIEQAVEPVGVEATPVQEHTGSYQATSVRENTGSYQAAPVQENTGTYQQVPTAAPVQQPGAYQANPSQPQGNGNYFNSMSSQNQYTNNMNAGSVPTPPVSSKPPKKTGKSGKAGKTGLIVGLVIALLVVISAAAAVVVFKPFGSKDPFDRLMMANYKLWKQKQMNLSTEFSVDLDDEDPGLVAMVSAANLPFQSTDEDVLAYLSAILGKYKLQYNTALDLKNSPVKMGFEGKLLYNKKDLFDARMNFRPWEASISSKLLLSKPLYIDFSKTISESTGVDISDVDIKPYLDIVFEEDDYIKSIPKSEMIKKMRKDLDLKGKNPKLKKIGKEKIEVGGKKINADKIRLEITYRDALDISNDMFTAMMKDPKFKKSLIGKTDKMLNKMLETGDYRIFGMDEDSFAEVMEETKDQLKSNYDDMMDSFLQEMQMSREMMENTTSELMDQTIIYDFYLVKDDLKRVSCSAETQGVSVKVDINILPFNDKILDIPSRGDSYNLENLMNENSQEIVMDVLSNVEDNILKEESFNDMLTDFKDEAREYLVQEDADMLETLIDQQLEEMLGSLKYLIP